MDSNNIPNKKLKNNASNPTEKNEADVNEGIVYRYKYDLKFTKILIIMRSINKYIKIKFKKSIKRFKCSERIRHRR